MFFSILFLVVLEIKKISLFLTSFLSCHQLSFITFLKTPFSFIRLWKVLSQLAPHEKKGMENMEDREDPPNFSSSNSDLKVPFRSLPSVSPDRGKKV